MLGNQSPLLNLEALVDGASNAVVAVRVTDAEDAAAVVQTFEQGLQTTQGQPPLAVTLDNRPSNFYPQVDQALSCTQLLRATPKRGQAKAPVEGAFGLFEQSLPGTLVFEGKSVREVLRSIAQKVAHAFFARRNGRPRTRLGGKSPAQAYVLLCATASSSRAPPTYLSAGSYPRCLLSACLKRDCGSVFLTAQLHRSGEGSPERWIPARAAGGIPVRVSGS